MTGMTRILGRLKKVPSCLNILTMEIVIVQVYFSENNDLLFATFILETTTR